MPLDQLMFLQGRSRGAQIVLKDALWPVSCLLLLLGKGIMLFLTTTAEIASKNWASEFLNSIQELEIE